MEIFDCNHLVESETNNVFYYNRLDSTPVKCLHPCSNSDHVMPSLRGCNYSLSTYSDAINCATNFKIESTRDLNWLATMM